MKYTVLIMALVSSPALAHAPHIQNCDEFAQVAHDAAIARDGGHSESDSIGVLWGSDLHFSSHYETYRALIIDVYEDPQLKVSTPEVIKRASQVSCLKFNDSERAQARHD